MSENIVIADLSEGDEFVGFYALKRCDLKEFDGGFRLDIELADSTGSLPGVIWDDAREQRELLSRGDVVKVKGRLGSYRDRPQIRIDKIRPAKEGEYEPGSFIPSTPKDIDTLIESARSLIESIEDSHLSQLGKLIFDNPQFI
ncbi:unnamed protein product, partial [marine sediment metagenome]